MAVRGQAGVIHTARSGSFRGGTGYVREVGLDGQVVEHDTLTCGHCSVVVLLAPGRVRPRGRCVRCSRYICDRCAALHHQTGQCLDTQEMLDLAVAFPGQGPFLARGPGGEPLFDPRLQDQRRVW